MKNNDIIPPPIFLKYTTNLRCRIAKSIHSLVITDKMPVKINYAVFLPLGKNTRHSRIYGKYILEQRP